MSQIFFFKKNKSKLLDIFPNLKLKNNFFINSVKPLNIADKYDITFLESTKYIHDAKHTKAILCITTKKLENYLPKKVDKIIVQNVLYEIARVLKKLYPSADVDTPDLSLSKPKVTEFKGVKFGNNVLVGNKVKIGKNSIIGANSIIEQKVLIGENCIIGSGCIIKNALIGNNVVIQDNCKIGQKGFGFIPLKNKNLKFPHIGRVIINNDSEIASGCTIDRGSINDTIIGSNTYLDNQVHVAHNVQIGSNCMVAGQVGFAGSSIIGNNVQIGGQAGISGHLTIGDNVKIGGGSGVVKNIEDNQTVMGYPAESIKIFLKKNKKNE